VYLRAIRTMRMFWPTGDGGSVGVGVVGVELHRKRTKDLCVMARNR